MIGRVRVDRRGHSSMFVNIEMKLVNIDRHQLE